jgi:alkylation response protein AidB-like acyl-CoA dehydrogenase
MDFDLTEEQALLQSTVRAYVNKEIAPQVADYEARGPLGREDTIRFIKELRPFGFYSGRAPVDQGGDGLDAKTYALINEELSRVWPGLCGTLWIAGSSGIGGNTPETERATALAQFRAGETISAGAISEPEHGSDASYMNTRATLDGDEWVINGTKTWISDGPIADRITVSVTIDPSLGRDGIRQVYVNKEQSPFEVVRHNSLLGLRAWPNGELRFDNVRVPRHHLSDPRQSAPETGHKRVWNFQTPRTMLAIMGVGIGQACIDDSIAYARERHQFGRPIGSFQLVQEMIVDMVIEVESARLLTYRAIDMQDKGQDSTWQAAAAKAFATEMSARVASKAIEIHGALGLLEGYPIERYFRDARSLSIPDGTTEIQKLVVGRRLIGISAIQ